MRLLKRRTFYLISRRCTFHKTSRYQDDAAIVAAHKDLKIAEKQLQEDFENICNRQDPEPSPPDTQATDCTTELPLPNYYYDMQKKGLLVIFDHYEFDKTFYKKRCSDRTSTTGDSKALKEIFEQLNFDVEIHNDFTYDEIMDIISDIASQDHADTSCLIVCILTRGYDGNTLYAYDRPYKLTELCEHFINTNCPSLANKPKIFFVQACRGASVDQSEVTIQAGYDGGSFDIFPWTSDILVMYSTSTEKVSIYEENAPELDVPGLYRGDMGSLFVQALCGVLEEHHAEWDLLRILTLVNQKVRLYSEGLVKTEFVSKLSRLLQFKKT